MSEKTPKITVVDCESGESVTRPMDKAEVALWSSDQAAAAAELALEAQAATPQTLSEQIAALDPGTATVADIIALAAEAGNG